MQQRFTKLKISETHNYVFRFNSGFHHTILNLKVQIFTYAARKTVVESGERKYHNGYVIGIIVLYQMMNEC